jgi:hypothetical protein
VGTHGLAGGAAGGGGGQAVVGAPLDGRAPELEPLHAPAAVDLRPHHRWPRGGGEVEVSEGCSGGGSDDEHD